MVDRFYMDVVREAEAGRRLRPPPGTSHLSLFFSGVLPSCPVTPSVTVTLFRAGPVSPSVTVTLFRAGSGHSFVIDVTQ